MSRQAAWGSFSIKEKSFRIACALAAAIVGYGATTHALAMAWRTSAPERAHALIPSSATVAATLSEKLSSMDITAANRAEAERLALLAIRADPTVIPAVATLGLNADLRGDSDSATRLLAYAQRLSRRDFRTQLWSIQSAVARGDVPEALKYYDITLRTTRSAPPVLFPVLSSAITDPSIRSELVKVLAKRPDWGVPYIEFVSGNGPDPAAISALFMALRKAGLPPSETADAAAVNAMLTAGMLDEAWSYYRLSHPRADIRISRDPHFDAAPAVPSAFDWTPVNDAGISGSIQRLDRSGLYDFSAAPGVSGVMLRQTMMLPPGEYRLKGHSAGITQSATSAPYWAVACAKGDEIGRVSVPNSDQAAGKFSGVVTIPAGCTMQILSFVAQPSDGAQGLSGQIDYLTLHPAN